MTSPTSPHLRESTYLPDQSFPINIFTVRKIRLHWHDHMEWMLVRSGRAVVQIDDTYMALHAGEMAFVNSKQLHAAVPQEDGTELLAVVFNDALMRSGGLDLTEQLYLSPYLNRGAKLPNFLQEGEPHTARIAASMAALVEEFQSKSEGFELLMKAELFRIFGLIYRYGGREGSASNRSRYMKSYNLTGLLDYLREHYAEEISVREAAERVNLSPNHFCKVFKKITGKTLITYLHLVRVNEAERLLRTTDMTITEIAEQVGFGSITYFGRVYKKIKHAAPSLAREA